MSLIFTLLLLLLDYSDIRKLPLRFRVVELHLFVWTGLVIIRTTKHGGRRLILTFILWTFHLAWSTLLFLVLASLVASFATISSLSPHKSVVDVLFHINRL